MTTITINLPPYLEEFLRITLGQRNKNESIVLTKRTEIGNFIISMVDRSEYPRTRTMHRPVDLILPEDKTLCFERYHVYISKYKELQIVLFLKAMFGLFTERVMITGERFGMQKKDLVDMLVNFFDDPGAINFEKLKKNDYRKRKRSADFILEAVQRFYI